MSKKLFIRKVKALFQKIHDHPWHQKLSALPFWMRISLAIISLTLGILGIILPVLPGWIGIVFALILLIGMRQSRRLFLKVIYFARMHIIFSRLYLWWKNK